MPVLRFRLLFVMLLLLVLMVSPVLAQGSLTYGSNAVGSLNATAPLTFFTFSGNVGDLVTVQVIEISPGLAPAVSLLGPTQQMIGSSLSDAFGLGDGEARLSVRLTETGVHSLLVSSANAGVGDFLLRLRGTPASVSTGVSQESAAAVDVIPGAGPQVFSIAADPGSSLPVSVTSVTSGFGFAVQVRDPLGQLVSVLSGSAEQPVTFLLPPGQGVFELVVNAHPPTASGSVVVAVGLPQLTPIAAGPEAQSPQTQLTVVPPAVEPAATEEVGPSTAGQTNGQGPVCRVRSNANVNLRANPSLTAPIIGVLISGSEQPAIGQSPDGVWYALSVNGQTVWVAAEVVLANGPCNVLPVLQGQQSVQPPSETEEVTNGQVPTSTHTATATVQGGVQVTASVPPQQNIQPTTAVATQPVVQATATFTPSMTPTRTPTVMPLTATYTPSYTPTTPPAAQVAPEDPRFNNPLNIPLDNTASVLDFVSYPGGDREDRVRWDIIGMNANASLSGARARLVLAVSCFGTGTNQIQFFTGGQTYSCGQTIVDREVTFDSRTGSVVITAVGGTNTYVQWVLTGTATRVN